MSYHLSAEDLVAVNRLLDWRAQTIAAGGNAHVELSEGDHGFCATIYDYGAEPGATGVHVAYERTVAAACNRAVDQAQSLQHERAPDTEPHHQKPSEPPTPLEELMS